jgi:glycosyltransferase involved in cell wall biosynthesis
MHPTLAIDLTCLLFGPSSLNPRGIDRVELAYAWHFFTHWPGECVAVVPTLTGIRYLDRSRAMRGLRAIEEIWRENILPEQDTSYHRTKSFLLTNGAVTGFGSMPGGKPLWRQARDFIRFLGAIGFGFGKSAGSLPQGAIYLNVGQLLFVRPLMSWLVRRPDILSVFMIHDLIPLEYPDHHISLGTRLHRNIVQNTAEFADALIVPSQLVHASLKRALLPLRPAYIPMHVELLPVSPAFLQPAETDPELSQANYFITVGAIEAHKNHVLLLEVWKELIALQGDRAPKLVIAGFRSVTSKPVFDFITRNPALRSKVMISSGLSTPALRRLIMSARALLMPSIAEGFGLPIIEALAQGTPVLASDISAMREAGNGGKVTYLPAADHAQWRMAIEGFKANGQPLQAEASLYIPKQWSDYFLGIEAFLAELAVSRSPKSQ